MNIDTATLYRPKPFLKWAGGKRQILPELLKHLPFDEKRGYTLGRYYEPFLGGGALFFELRALGWTGRATLADANERLIRYAGVKDDVEAVITILQMYPYDEKFYYKMRAAKVDDLDNTSLAAWFIYMNRACFNGLYRVNRKGQFNVPFGKYVNPTICDAEGLRAASRALIHTKMLIGSFEHTTRHAVSGDFVYFDPPYVPASATANFTAYTVGGFGPTEQKQLFDWTKTLRYRGARVMLSNADTPAVHQLNKTTLMTMHRIEARRNINSKGSARGKVGEVIFT